MCKRRFLCTQFYSSRLFNISSYAFMCAILYVCSSAVFSSLRWHSRLVGWFEKASSTPTYKQMNTSNLRSYDTFDEVLSAGPLHHHGHFPDQFPILWSTTSSPRSRFTSWSTSSLTFLSVLINDLILVYVWNGLCVSVYPSSCQWFLAQWLSVSVSLRVTWSFKGGCGCVCVGIGEGGCYVGGGG